MQIKFNFFKALAGDSILISTDKTNILIDGGFGITYEEQVKPKINRLNNCLDLVVLTHIDEDHICGLIEMIKNDRKNTNKIKKLWFNSIKSIRVRKNKNVSVSYRQADTFDILLQEHNVPVNNGIFLTNSENQKKYPINNEIELQLLSPYESDLRILEKKEPKNQTPMECLRNKATQVSTTFGNDKRPPNKSSIAFILKYDTKSFLFLADANIEVINRSLDNLGYSEHNKLDIEFVKLSHHGSLENINEDFLKMISTEKFIILTDGKNKHNNHPSKEIFPLIIKHQAKDEDIEFIFNYEGIKNRKLQEAKDNNIDLKRCTFKVLARNFLEV
jgi:beta-lactamase superfamily II metal-dependent hydrolase